MSTSNGIPEMMSPGNDIPKKKNVNEDTAYFRSAEEIKVFIMSSQKVYATVLFVLVGLSIAFAIAGIQVTYKVNVYEKIKADALNKNLTSNNSKDVIKKTTEDIFLFSNIKLGVESALTVVTLATCGSLYYYYRTIFLLKKVRNDLPKTVLFINAKPLFNKFLIEIFFCALHLPPLLSTYVNPKYQLIVFIRIYLIGRYLQQKHSLMHSQSTRCLARLGNTKLTSMFLVKASFRKYPFHIMVFGYTTFVLISTYVVWLLEETYSYFDTMWMLIIAMTTVGFGDLTPQTTLGRIAVTLTSLVGILFIAIFCFIASQAIAMQREELRVLAYYETKEKVRQLKIAALNAIGMWYKFYSYKSKYFPDDDDVHGDGTSFLHNRKNKKACSLRSLKLKNLKTSMYKGITFWRSLRNDPEGVSYNQEFVLEEMKVMVHNMSENVDELSERPIENLFLGCETHENADDVCNAEHDTNDGYIVNNSQPPHTHLTHQEVIPLVKIIPPSYDVWNGKTKTDNVQVNTLPHQGIRNRTYSHNVIGNNRRGDVMFNNPNAAKILEELLSEMPHDEHDCSQRDKNIMIAFNLIKIQHNILNNAIETIYHKTKHDVSDIQRRLSSFTRPSGRNHGNIYETGF